MHQYTLLMVLLGIFFALLGVTTAHPAPEPEAAAVPGPVADPDAFRWFGGGRRGGHSGHGSSHGGHSSSHGGHGGGYSSGYGGHHHHDVVHYDRFGGHHHHDVVHYHG